MMKPWKAYGLILALCAGCASDPAPRGRCRGPWTVLRDASPILSSVDSAHQLEEPPFAQGSAEVAP